MTNAIDYIKWRGDLSFSSSPLNEVDIFIFSQLSTPDYTGIVPGYSFPYIRQHNTISVQDAVKSYFSANEDSVSTLGMLQSQYVHPMLHLLPETKRFGNLCLSDYVNKVDSEQMKQFSAVTILLPDGSRCISFRGTDDTIIGWKEDFYLAVTDKVPAQQDALEYLKNSAAVSPGDIYVCGHSKGGNLAVYAAAHAPEEIRSRIKYIYNFDGPGFSREFTESEGYLAIRGKLFSVLSQNSTVGTLLTSVGTIIYTHSSKSGPTAHDGFTWEVLGNQFIRENRLSETSKYFQEAMADTLSDMDTTERKEFVDELFDLLLSTGADTITDLVRRLSGKKLTHIIDFIRSFHASKRVTAFIQSIAGNYLGIAYEENTARITAGGAELISSVREGIDQRIDKIREEIDVRIETAREGLDQKIDLAIEFGRDVIPVLKRSDQESLRSPVADPTSSSSSAEATFSDAAVSCIGITNIAEEKPEMVFAPSLFSPSEETSLSPVIAVSAWTDKRIFFRLENEMFASAPTEAGVGNIILYPQKDIFIQYLYDDIPSPSEEMVKNAAENYYRFGCEARLMVMD